MRPFAIFAVCVGCYGDPPMVAVDLAGRFHDLSIDDSLGLACATSTASSIGYKGEISETTSLGPCFAGSNLPAWTAALERNTFDVRDYIDSLVIDDTNSLVCLELDSTITQCFPQAALDATGVATL